MPNRPKRKQLAVNQATTSLESFAGKITVPVPEFCKAGDLLKITAGDALGLARVTNAETSCPALELIKLGSPTEHEGKMCWWVIEFLKCDANRNRLGIVRRDWLPVRHETEARAIFEREREKMFERHRKMREQYKLLSDMPTAERDAQSAQWEVLKEVWPETVRSLQANLDPTKDYNAETIAITKSPRLPIEAGDAEAMDKILKAQDRKREFDPVNIELSVNWIKEGYCNMKPEEYTAKINAKLGTNLPVGTMRARAITKLRLTSRRLCGRPANDGELPTG
jgi:hypothetical protein